MRRTALIAAFVAFCLVGCTASDTPVGPTSSASSDPSLVSVWPPVSPSAPTVPADVPTTGPNLRYRGEKPPVEPVAALEHTADGAKAFAEFFIKTIDWGYATMSGAYLRHYEAPACTTCRSLADGIDADRRQGRKYIGGRLSRVVSSGKQTQRQIVRVNATSFEEVDQDGRFVTGDRAYTGQEFELRIEWLESGWRVTHIAVVQ
jgi:Family of unknown function (DUF6318)